MDLPDGERFGLPKDWDTIAVVINEDMMNDAGLSIDDFNNATWNPQDGGTGEIIQALPADANGVRGNEDGFDSENVAVYGFGLEGNFGAFGQTTFSAFAAANGWTAVDTVWADSANYDDLALAETSGSPIDAAGYITLIEDVQSLGGTTMFQSGQAATQTNGSWMISTLSGDATEVPVVYAPTPVGLVGDRARCSTASPTRSPSRPRTPTLLGNGSSTWPPRLARRSSVAAQWSSRPSRAPRRSPRTHCRRQRRRRLGVHHPRGQRHTFLFPSPTPAPASRTPSVRSWSRSSEGGG